MVTKNSYSKLFYLRPSKNALTGSKKIYMRITVNGQQAVFSTGHSIEAKKWDQKRNQAKGSSQEAIHINERLNYFKSKADESYQRLRSQHKNIRADFLVDVILDKKPEYVSLMQAFELHNADLLSRVGVGYAKATYIRYETTKRIVTQFLEQRERTDDILLEELENPWIERFDLYLRTVRKCNNNTSVKYVKNVRKIINWSIKQGWLDKDPFIRYEGKVHETQRGYLTIEEVKVLQAFIPTSDRLEVVRDLFLFSCFTGLSYADMMALMPEDISRGMHGKHISIRRKKTDTQCRIPLFLQAEEILDKYASYPECIINGTLLPKRSNQKMNDYLKEIQSATNITTRMSCHLARHTFGTMYLELGGAIEVVQEILGHRDLRTTRIYAKITGKRIHEDSQSVIKRLNVQLNQQTGAEETINRAI